MDPAQILRDVDESHEARIERICESDAWMLRYVEDPDDRSTSTSRSRKMKALYERLILSRR